MAFITSDDIKPYLTGVDISDTDLNTIVADAQNFVLSYLKERLTFFNRNYIYNAYDYLGNGSITIDSDITYDDIKIIVLNEEGEVTEIVTPQSDGNYTLHFYNDEGYYVWIVAVGYKFIQIYVYNTGDLGTVTLQKSNLITEAMKKIAVGRAIEAAGYKYDAKIGNVEVKKAAIEDYEIKAKQYIAKYLTKGIFNIRSA